MLMHVLGADIPHHNRTILRFFNDILAPRLPAAWVTHFSVVAANRFDAAEFPALTITQYPHKKALAHAVIKQAKKDRNTRFFWHGQFNVWLWLALLVRQIAPKQIYWHIWGADLYEGAKQLKFRVFYLLRHLAQRRFAKVFGTQGDLNYYQKRHQKTAVGLLYFPTKLTAETSSATNRRHNEKVSCFTILVGNSGDRSNQHIPALRHIAKHFDRNIRIIIPMGYPNHNEAYIAEVSAEADRLFKADAVQIITDNLAFQDYLEVLQQCDLGYFNFARQQGIGTLCLLMQYHIPFVLNRDNPFWQDLAQQNVPLLFSDDALTIEQITAVRHKLTQLDLATVAFFPPNYIQGWITALMEIGANQL